MTEAEVISNTLMCLFNELKLDSCAINEVLSIIVPHSAVSPDGAHSVLISLAAYHRIQIHFLQIKSAAPGVEGCTLLIGLDFAPLLVDWIAGHCACATYPIDPLRLRIGIDRLVNRLVLKVQLDLIGFCFVEYQGTVGVIVKYQNGIGNINWIEI